MSSESVSQAIVDELAEIHQTIKLKTGDYVLHFANRLPEVESRLSAIGNIIRDDERLHALLRRLLGVHYHERGK